MGKLTSDSDLNESLSKAILDINQHLEKHEKIEKVIVFNEQWTIENNFLTPTLKLKRVLIEKVHEANYSNWFNKKETIIIN